MSPRPTRRLLDPFGDRVVALNLGPLGKHNGALPEAPDEGAAGDAPSPTSRLREHERHRFPAHDEPRHREWLEDTTHRRTLPTALQSVHLLHACDRRASSRPPAERRLRHAQTQGLAFGSIAANAAPPGDIGEAS